MQLNKISILYLPKYKTSIILKIHHPKKARKNLIFCTGILIKINDRVGKGILHAGLSGIQVNMLLRY
jgi:hypothetical protein